MSLSVYLMNNAPFYHHCHAAIQKGTDVYSKFAYKHTLVLCTLQYFLLMQVY